MTVQIQTGIDYFGYVDGEMVQWWLFEGEHLAVRTLDDTRIFIAKENWAFHKKLIGFDQIEFKILYLRTLHFFKMKVNSKRDLMADGRTFAMRKNGPFNLKIRPFSDIFNGEKILDPDGLIYGKDTKPYIDQIFGVLHLDNEKPFFVFWRSLKSDAGTGCLLAQQESRVFIIQDLIRGQSVGEYSIKLEGVSGDELEICPEHLSEVKDGVVAKAILLVSQLHNRVGRIRPPNNLPMVPLNPTQLANTKLAVTL